MLAYTQVMMIYLFRLPTKWAHDEVTFFSRRKAVEEVLWGHLQALQKVHEPKVIFLFLRCWVMCCQRSRQSVICKSLKKAVHWIESGRAQTFTSNELGIYSPARVEIFYPHPPRTRKIKIHIAPTPEIFPAPTPQSFPLQPRTRTLLTAPASQTIPARTCPKTSKNS